VASGNRIRGDGGFAFVEEYALDPWPANDGAGDNRFNWGK
jgi:hypothetical protein